ncbi:hypothetical protein DSCO28_57460 [Desulfosarcina ovata subsp. sediminis]|uniref:Uncharacterized protein n=1 Tax=Desulfosarcina ovata subsp. sediminis TaxID=885957 RepID=A0A5K7ZYL1_9BACT|nr:DUF523 domain-containing protein [Desulfosarcina ovata]BBO85180.1 hypothetical protein DSCO28_57460 [Desulfosarcina ovata subsp. sediminis]
MILVSACLCGQPCRYDGRSKPHPRFMNRQARDGVLPICPEQLGGLSTPRTACSLFGGDGADVLAGRATVVDRFGADRTQAFIQGARRTLEMAEDHGIRRCCLKAKSPSCGSATLRLPADGAWPQGYRPVLGVTAALLLAHGMQIEEIP